MDDPAENAPAVLEWDPRLDVVGGDAPKRIAPELESMGGGAAGEGGRLRRRHQRRRNARLQRHAGGKVRNAQENGHRGVGVSDT